MSDKIKSWIRNNIVDLGGDDETPKSVPVQSTAKPVVPQVIIPQVNIPVVKPSEKFLNYFEELIKKSNLPGLDFFEFMDILNKMSANPALNFQEDQKFTMAWISFTSAGASTDKSLLVNTAQHYLDLLNKDKEKFTNMVNSEIENTVGSLKKSVQNLDDRNIKIQEEITRLQQEMVNNNTEKANLNIQITEQTSKISNKQNEYLATHSQIYEQIKSDIVKIQTYIK